MLTSFALLLLPLAGENLMPNGGFEAGLERWSGGWSRDAGALTVTVERTAAPEGQQCVKLVHTGSNDWSLQPDLRYDVTAGDLYEFSAQVRLVGSGDVTVCAITYDAQNQAVSWSAGGVSSRQTPDGGQAWRTITGKLIVPDGVVRILPRVIGTGAAEVWVDDFRVIAKGNVADFQAKDVPAPFTFANDALAVTFDFATLTMAVQDKRAGRTWSQRAGRPELVARKVTTRPDGVDVDVVSVLDGKSYLLKVTLAAGAAEVVAELAGEGAMPDKVAFPPAFESPAEGYVILPLNEGIAYPVGETNVDAPREPYFYGGYGLCMAFFGVTSDEGDGPAMMAIVETPDDASLRLVTADGKLHLAPVWVSQRGVYGYPRRLRYVFFGSGGYVAMCQRYRAAMQAEGRLVTLREKVEQRPQLDKLLGAANIWCWDGDAAGWCERLQALGIQRILWSNRQPPEQIATLNAMPDVISSRYDIYQDVMDPGKKDQLRGWHSDWPSEAWPQDLMLDERGQWRPGWQVKAKDGTMIPCGVLCDKQAPDYARQRIAAELQDSRYQSRFIDTTTASPWRECYHPDHPMTRSESRQFKMELLKVVADEFNLITGCETGHDAAVPYCDYFEGMLSLGPYRVPDSGRDMARLWDEVPERVGTYQTGERYRLPLWELVYHDCVVAQWYWGDYNNKLPSLWDRRDLWNALYATPPMYMFNKAVFEQYQDRFVKSYQTIAPIVREAAYQPMVSHKWLTADHTVQQTTFANGLTVTVNFGNQPYPSPGDSVFQPTGPIVQPMSYDVQHASIRGIPGTPNF